MRNTPLGLSEEGERVKETREEKGMNGGPEKDIVRLFSSFTSARKGGTAE